MITTLAQQVQETQPIDWVKVLSAAWALFLTVVLPILVKRYATVRKIVDVIVKGVDEGDHPETKQAIQKIAQAAGVESSLAPIVAKVKEAEQDPPPPAPLPRVGPGTGLLVLLALGGSASGCRADAAKLAALDGEVASLTSIALTVDWFPSSKDLSGKIYMDRTEEQKARIAAAGETIRAHVHELAGE